MTRENTENGMTCPRCGDLAPWDSVVCTRCGTRLTVKPPAAPRSTRAGRQAAPVDEPGDN